MTTALLDRPVTTAVPKHLAPGHWATELVADWHAYEKAAEKTVMLSIAGEISWARVDEQTQQSVAPMTYAPGRAPVNAPPAPFTAAALIAEVRRVADAAPGYVYRPWSNPTGLVGAWYVGSKAPGGADDCLLGRALMNLGIDPYQLSGYEGRRIGSVLNGLGIITSTRERQWLDKAQCAQDGSTPWGEAVAFADEVCGRLFGPLGKQPAGVVQAQVHGAFPRGDRHDVAGVVDFALAGPCGVLDVDGTGSQD